MGPVDQAAVGIPFVLSRKFHGITNLEPGYARGQVDVVGHQQGLAGGQPEDEALVTAPPGVILEKFDYPARTAYLEIAQAVAKSPGYTFYSPK